MSSKNFYCSDSNTEFMNSLSCERFSTYLDSADGNQAIALRDCAWNTAISAAFYGPLQCLEIALRNAMHRELSKKYGLEWFENCDAGLNKGARKKIQEAKITARYHNGSMIEVPKVVAVLSFGFWVSLIDSGRRFDSDGNAHCDYEETLWRPALHLAFPAFLTRKKAHNPLNYLRKFRNRIAHHEPIFKRHLSRDHERILEITGWISPETAAWIRHHSRVEELLLSKDTDRAIKF